MSLDFRQVQAQVKKLGENASARQQLLRARRETARRLLQENATEFEALKDKIERIVQTFDASLRCAAPASQLPDGPEALNAACSNPALPSLATILAADGSQINLDRHSEVEFCLVNVGAIQYCLGCPDPPQSIVRSDMKYDEALYTSSGLITEGRLALMRDQAERAILAELAAKAQPPVITFTDGPIELWGPSESTRAESDFKDYLKPYLKALAELCQMGVVTAGYVDKPSSDPVVRLLEICMASEHELKEIRKYRPLRGVTDRYLFSQILKPGQRSAIFELQAQSKRDYAGELALHFFYLNVGREERPWLARVEAPGWVVSDPEKMNMLQSVLVDQCKVMGANHYPYLLHRAHETAVVSLEEKEQVTQMIALELRRRGVEVGEKSHKQASKDLGGRTRYP